MSLEHKRPARQATVGTGQSGIETRKRQAIDSVLRWSARLAVTWFTSLTNAWDVVICGCSTAVARLAATS